MENLEFAFKVVKYVKSNGIAIAKGYGYAWHRTGADKPHLGSGDGARAERRGSKGAVMASDAFFRLTTV